MSGAVRWIGALGTLLVLATGTTGAAGEMIAAVTDASAGSNGCPIIEIWKSERKLEMRQGDALLGQFRIALGQQPLYGKERQGDGRTPVGRYYVSDRKADTPFHRFLGISYPNADDAERGYERRLIDASEWADIFFANLRGDAPPWHTVLGGRVGIHGYGDRPYLPIDWTEGCIAVSNEDIELIYDHTTLGTPVIINE